MAESKELSKTNSAVVLRDSSSPESVAELSEILAKGSAEGLQNVVTDPQQIQLEIARRILESDSWEMPEAVGWEKREGIPFEVHGFRWAPSTYEEGPPVFLIVDAVNLTDGSRELLTTGAYTPLCQLAKMAKDDVFPVHVMLKVSDRQTKSGYNPHSLVPVPREQAELAKDMSDPELPF